MTDTEANAAIAQIIIEAQRQGAETATLNAELARTIAETRKLNVEVPKLQNETVNFAVSRGKMYLEVIFMPLVVLGTWTAAIVGVLAAFRLLK